MYLLTFRQRERTSGGGGVHNIRVCRYAQDLDVFNITMALLSFKFYIVRTNFPIL